LLSKNKFMANKVVLKYHVTVPGYFYAEVKSLLENLTEFHCPGIIEVIRNAIGKNDKHNFLPTKEELDNCKVFYFEDTVILLLEENPNPRIKSVLVTVDSYTPDKVIPIFYKERMRGMPSVRRFFINRFC